METGKSSKSLCPSLERLEDIFGKVSKHLKNISFHKRSNDENNNVVQLTFLSDGDFRKLLFSMKEDLNLMSNCD